MRKTIVIFISLLTLIGLSCGLFTPKEDGRSSWPTPVVSENEAQKFKENVKSAGDQLNANQPVVLVVTESELTSFVVFELQNQDISVIQDPQIYLRDGNVKVYGQYEEAGTTLNVSVQLRFAVLDGKIQIQIETVSLNGFNAPDSLASKVQMAISEQVEPALNQWLGDGMYIDTLQIGDGILTITGHKP